MFLLPPPRLDAARWTPAHIHLRRRATSARGSRLQVRGRDGCTYLDRVLDTPSREHCPSEIESSIHTHTHTHTHIRSVQKKKASTDHIAASTSRSSLSHSLSLRGPQRRVRRVGVQALSGAFIPMSRKLWCESRDNPEVGGVFFTAVFRKKKSTAVLRTKHPNTEI